MPSFSKVWAASCLGFFPVSDVLPDIYGTLRGESIVKASLMNTDCRFCKRFPVSTRRSSRNSRELQPIMTEGFSWMGWKCSAGCLPTHSSVDMGLRICTGQAAPDSPVHFGVITHPTASADIYVAPGPFPPNVWATGVQRGVQDTYPWAR